MRAVGALLVVVPFVAWGAVVSACGDAFSAGTQDAAVDASGDVVVEAAADGGPAPCGNVPDASEVFAHSTTSPDHVATDGAYLYWASSTSGAIERARLASALPATVEPVATRSPIQAIAVANSYLCWLMPNARMTSGVVECGVTDMIGDGGLSDASVLYVSNESPYLVGRPVDFVIARPFSGLQTFAPPNPPNTILTSLPGLVASVPPVVVLAIATDAGPNTLLSIQDHPSDQSLGVPLLVDTRVPTALATDGLDVFIAYGGDESVSRLPLDGAAEVPLATQLTGPGSLRVDASNVYVATALGIVRFSKTDGSCATTISTEQTRDFVIAGDYVYFASQGNVLRARK